MLIVDKSPGNTLSADEFNQIPNEIESVITAAGLTPLFNIEQLLPSINLIVGTSTKFFTDAGLVNAYALSPAGTAPTAYTDGMTVEFVPDNVSTSTTVTVDVNGLGIKSVKAAYGSTVDPSIGKIQGLTTLMYDGTNFGIVDGKEPLSNDVSLEGFVAAGTSTSKLISLNTSDQVEVSSASQTTSVLGTVVDVSGSSALNLLSDTAISLKIGAGEENALIASPGSDVKLYFNNAESLITQNFSDISVTSTVGVRDGANVLHDVGFNVMPIDPSSGNDSFTRENCGFQLIYDGSGPHTYTVNADASIPDGATWTVFNIGTAVLTISGGSNTMTWMDGSGALVTGDVILDIAGIATLTKRASNQIMVFGAGLST